MPTIQLEQVSLYFEEHGAGPPLLLLHGLGSSGQDWELVLPQLAARHRVIVPDVRGHGRSDKPPGPYGIPLFAQDIAALCDRLGIRSAHVVDHAREPRRERLAQPPAQRAGAVTRARRTLTEILGDEVRDLATLSVAARQLRSMTTRTTGTGNQG